MRHFVFKMHIELIEGDSLENYFRSMRLPPPKAKSSGSDRELPSIASGKSFDDIGFISQNSSFGLQEHRLLLRLL